MSDGLDGLPLLVVTFDLSFFKAGEEDNAPPPLPGDIIMDAAFDDEEVKADDFVGEPIIEN